MSVREVNIVTHQVVKMAIADGLDYIEYYRYNLPTFRENVCLGGYDQNGDVYDISKMRIVQANTMQGHQWYAFDDEGGSNLFYNYLTDSEKCKRWMMHELDRLGSMNSDLFISKRRLLSSYKKYRRLHFYLTKRVDNMSFFERLKFAFTGNL